VSQEIIKNEFSILGTGNLINENKNLKSLEDYIVTYLSRFSIDQFDDNDKGLYQSVLLEFEKPVLKYVLKATGGNQIKASKILGLNRNTLRKKLRLLNIEYSKIYD
jgi:two-component system nitrogen regulation response regulator GlnG